ncbi:MAG TPA: HNH endonuclease [bacterium]|nr:HNH endonuclease [bacterium]
MLSSPVLVLNRFYMPVNIVTARRAFCMLVADVARAVDEEHRTFDFSSWAELSAAVRDDTVGLVGRLVRVPRVVLLSTYDRFPKRTVRFSRLNIMLRDRHTCQYCGKKMTRSALNIDHVVPRVRGGQTTWENVVASCHACNRKKGSRLPEEAGMKLLKLPVKPRTTPFVDLIAGPIRYEEWKPFFNMVDFSYWNVELEK